VKGISLMWVMLLSLICGGCMQTISAPPLTQLQIREIQSRDFDARDVKLVMKTMMDVLQDDGFVIKNAVSDLGLLNAEKVIDIERNRFHHTSYGTSFGVSYGRSYGGSYGAKNQEAHWDKQQIIEASANVSSYGDKVRVRINFQTKNIDNFGCPTDVRTVLNSEYYQTFFEKVSKGIFLQQENI
jgi:hypothetical protein